ncbi:Auxin transporter-like protein [Vigna angularis]|uniref:Auxin transporter-like protein n=1 Tax=Phaseolus angularis TaxID=3914 RepID=A0A8T0L8U3_PHAAN|nr:Auxin transporter-like protein [Vigna angularis]
MQKKKDHTIKRRPSQTKDCDKYLHSPTPRVQLNFPDLNFFISYNLINRSCFLLAGFPLSTCIEIATTLAASSANFSAFNTLNSKDWKKMSRQKQGEEAMMSSLNQTVEREEGEEVKGETSHFTLKNAFWHGGSAYDAWFSCASNQVNMSQENVIRFADNYSQVAQVLLTLPYSFAQLGVVSGVVFQVFYGLLGSYTAYLISTLYIEYRSRKEKENVSFKNHVIQWFEVNIYYINDHMDKRTWTYIFGACCATTVFIPSFHNYRIWSFLGLGMTTYTAWYLTIASLVHGQVENVTHSGPKKLVLYFTGATNILYTFGGHAVTVEIMHAMWKPQKFKYIYLYATFYVFTLTIPSAVSVYWAFGDQLLNHSNAFSLLPRTGWRDAGVILMLIHQIITFGFACTPLYFVWEKVIGMHDTKSICLRALARLPVVIPIWFLAIIFPFFGPINSAVGALLVSFTVYIIPASAHMLTFRSAAARQNAAEKLPFFIPNWTLMYVVNALVVVWVLVVGFGFGGWASMVNFIKQVDTFGLFAKCYQCPPKLTNHTLHHS